MATRQRCYYLKEPIKFEGLIRPERNMLCKLAENVRQTAERQGVAMPPECKAVNNVDDMKRYFSHDGISIQADIDGPLALLFQKETGSEIGVNLVYHKKSGEGFSLVTRRGPEMVVFDYLSYYLLSPEYRVIPLFHTHLKMESELGSFMPSLFDLQSLYYHTIIQGNHQMFNTVIFPNYTGIVYSVDDNGIPYIEEKLDSVIFREQ